MTKLIAEKYPQFKVSFSKTGIKIFRGGYFYTILNKHDKEFRITIYSGLLAYLLNKNFKKKILALRIDLEKILTENSFNFSYVNMNS